jgi:anaerobic selenocysteine-containing dehydrogenase
VGEKTAFNFMAFWEAEHVRINPADARRIAVKPGESVMIRSKNGDAEFAAELSDAIPAGVLAVPAETDRTKFLFEFEIDQGFVNFPPTDVELCRKE